MLALRIHEQRGPEGLAHEEAPIPEPGTGDVLVRVHAASFTPTELTWPSTWVDRLGHDRRPVIPGHEVSETVEALGVGDDRVRRRRGRVRADRLVPRRVAGRVRGGGGEEPGPQACLPRPCPGCRAPDARAHRLAGNVPPRRTLLGTDGADPRCWRGSGARRRPAGQSGGRSCPRRRPRGCPGAGRRARGRSVHRCRPGPVRGRGRGGGPGDGPRWWGDPATVRSDGQGGRRRRFRRGGPTSPAGSGTSGPRRVLRGGAGPTRSSSS